MQLARTRRKPTTAQVHRVRSERNISVVALMHPIDTMAGPALMWGSVLAVSVFLVAAGVRWASRRRQLRRDDARAQAIVERHLRRRLQEDAWRAYFADLKPDPSVPGIVFETSNPLRFGESIEA